MGEKLLLNPWSLTRMAQSYRTSTGIYVLKFPSHFTNRRCCYIFPKCHKIPFPWCCQVQLNCFEIYHLCSNKDCEKDDKEALLFHEICVHRSQMFKLAEAQSPGSLEVLSCVLKVYRLVLRFHFISIGLVLWRVGGLLASEWLLVSLPHGCLQWMWLAWALF